MGDAEPLIRDPPAVPVTEPVRVAALSLTPVKGLQIVRCGQLLVGRDGAHGDRRFYLIDDRMRMVNGKHIGALNEVTANLDDGLRPSGTPGQDNEPLPSCDAQSGERERLTLAFPDGSRVSDEVHYGQQLTTSFYSAPRLARVVRGPFAEALSSHVGHPLRLVRATDGSSALDRGERGAISLISRASLRSLAEASSVSEIDARRFRMSIELEGIGPFEEDSWIGGQVRIGSEVMLHLHGHVGRCLVTSRHPQTGVSDLPTLELLRDLRAGAQSTEPLPLGIHGSVLAPGPIRVGDRIEIA